MLYASKCQAELEEETERRRRLRQISREQCRVMRMTPVRERKMRISEKEMPPTRSAASRMVCCQVLFLRKGKGDRAVLRSDGVPQLGALRTPERRARLAVLSLSVGAAAATMRPELRSANGETNESGLSKI